MIWLLPFTVTALLFIGTLLLVGVHWVVEIVWDELKRAVDQWQV